MFFCNLFTEVEHFPDKCLLDVKSTEVQYCNKILGVFFYLSAVVKNVFHAFVYIIRLKFLYIMLLYKKVVPSVFLEAFFLVLHFPFTESQLFF